MKKSEMLRKELSEIEKEIAFLQNNFRKTPEANRFLRTLHGRRSVIRRKIELSQTRVQRRGASPEQLERAQHNRSEKNKRNWRYAKAIADNYDIPVQKVRGELKKRKEGLESDIQDVIWRNPSP